MLWSIRYFDTKIQAVLKAIHNPIACLYLQHRVKISWNKGDIFVSTAESDAAQAILVAIMGAYLTKFRLRSVYNRLNGHRFGAR